MSVLSLEFLALSLGSAVFLWIFSYPNRKYTLALCNLVFLWLLSANLLDIAYVLGLFLYTYLFGLLLGKGKARKWLLVFIVLLPILGLAFFKYAGYFLVDRRILMPLGLSFYTFKAISYLVDVYKGICVCAKNPIEVFDYIVFFPAFMAGPIHRPGPFLEELRTPFHFEYKDQKNGFVLAALGLFQKLVIGDQLAHLMRIFLDSSLNGAYTLLGVILYAFYIYVDFDSYSNVAIGVARMFGFHLERNFHTPYLAVSIRDFWQRWHISLSSWLRDYVYIPLGGSRKGTFLKYINTLIVFLVSGIWHGSTMMFIVWGLGHGILNILEDLIRKLFGGVKPWMKWFAPLAIVLNFVLVASLWMFFQAGSMQEALDVFARIASGNLLRLDYALAGITKNEWMWMWILLGMVVFTDILRYFFPMIEVLSKQFILFRWIIYAALIIIAIIFGVYGPGYDPANFIYVTF
ncbi:MAG: MBOAT family protein [Solobacterium sp.]|nr:MBOAT family protein [Solobacterium sp.]